MVGMSACEGRPHTPAIYNLHLVEATLGILQSCMLAKPTSPPCPPIVHRDTLSPAWKAIEPKPLVLLLQQKHKHLNVFSSLRVMSIMHMDASKDLSQLALEAEEEMSGLSVSLCAGWFVCEQQEKLVCVRATRECPQKCNKMYICVLRQLQPGAVCNSANAF